MLKVHWLKTIRQVHVGEKRACVHLDYVHGVYSLMELMVRRRGVGRVCILACSVVCRRLRAGCGRLLVIFVISFGSFRLLVQHVVCLKAGGDPEWTVCFTWSHWAEFKHSSSCFAGRQVWWPSAVFRLTVVLVLVRYGAYAVQN